MLKDLRPDKLYSHLNYWYSYSYKFLLCVWHAEFQGA